MHQTQKDLLSLSRNVNLAEKSLREIGALIGVEHPQQVQHHLKQLQKKGFLVHDQTKNEIVNVNRKLTRERQFINIPIVGAANCGPAQLMADENIEGYLKLSRSMIRNKDVIAIRAEGDSMNKAKIDGGPIQTGDYVIVDYKQQAPNHGDYVLAVVDGAANIKRYYDDKPNGQVMLISESTYDYPPICIHESDYSDLMINGKVLKVVKQPKF
jgi:repressor LexA